MVQGKESYCFYKLSCHVPGEVKRCPKKLGLHMCHLNNRKSGKNKFCFVFWGFFFVFFDTSTLVFWTENKDKGKKGMCHPCAWKSVVTIKGCIKLQAY